MDPTLVRTNPAIGPPAPPRPEAAPLVGYIGRFALLRQLGAGAMGVVYAAYDEELDRRVAIKLLHAGDGDTEGRGRMQREAQAMARLSHPHVVQIYEVGVHAQQVFVAMEFVDGQTLGEWQRSGERTPAQILGLYLQAGEGLAAAHAAGLVHRDFKPDNVLVGNDGHVRVGDFGLARASDLAASPSPPPAPLTSPQQAPAALAATLRPNLLGNPLTLAGALVGTPAYMSPEQLRGAAVDARSDQFSFCAALYEALYGQRPFAGETLAQLIDSVLTGAPRTPPSTRAVAPWLLPLLLRGLARDPAERFPDMPALLAELARDERRDPRQAAPERRRFAIAMSIAIATTLSILLRNPPPPGQFVGDPFDLVRVAVAALAALVLAVLLLGRSMLRNHFHRAVIVLGWLAALQMLLVRLVLVLADVPPVVILRVDLTVDTVILVAGALLVAPLFWWVAAVAAIGVVVSHVAAPDTLAIVTRALYPGMVVVFLIGWNRGAAAPTLSRAAT